MVRSLTRRFAVGVLGLLAAVLAVAGSGSEVSAQYPYNYGYGYGGQQFQQFGGQQFGGQQYGGQQFVGQQFPQYQQFNQGSAIAPPFAAAPRYYYRDNRYCGDGVLFIENGINFCGNTGVRVFPIYPDFVPYGYGQFGNGQFNNGYNQFGYGYR